MTVLALKIFLTFLVTGWCLGRFDGYTGKGATLIAFLGVVSAVGAALSGFAWVMLFIWLPW